MKTSEKTDKLTPAMCKAFGAMGAAFKTGKNPHFKSRYADLRAVDEASRAVLAEHDLFVTQGVVEGLGGLAMQTTIMHGASGQFISQLVPFVVPRGRTEDPQAYGSALTYSRRYGLQSALGMVSEDDDGEAAARIARAQKQANPAGAIKDLKKACIDEGISLVLVEDFAQAEMGMSVKELDSDKIASLKAEIMNRKDNFRKDK
tara:strand:- start:1313 stop:1921 length:609 start_codon:yes stop_codon:yes gene_type:complete